LWPFEISILKAVEIVEVKNLSAGSRLSIIHGKATQFMLSAMQVIFFLVRRSIVIDNS
jgi:hypothetical protein